MGKNSKIDRIEEWLFSLSPSFYAIVAGVLIGVATELLSTFVFAQKEIHYTVSLAIFIIFLSSAFFAAISIILEQLRAEVTGEGEATRKYNLRGEIHKRRKTLWPLFIGVLASLACIIIILIMVL